MNGKNGNLLNHAGLVTVTEVKVSLRFKIILIFKE